MRERQVLYRILIAAVVLMSLAAGIATAGIVTQRFTYQGKLTDAAGNPLTGTSTVRFSLYDVATGGTALVQNTQTVTAANGLFTTPVLFIPERFNGQALWLGIQVGSDPEMTPRQEIRPVPYALSLRPGALVSGAGTSPALVLENFGGKTALNMSVSGRYSTAAFADTQDADSDAFSAVTTGGDSDAFSATTFGINGKGLNVVTHGPGSEGVSVKTDGYAGYGFSIMTEGDNSWGGYISTEGKKGTGIIAQTYGEDAKGFWTETYGRDSEGVYAYTANDSSEAFVAWTQGENSDGLTVHTEGAVSEGVMTRTDGDYSNGFSTVTYGEHSTGLQVRTTGYKSAGINVTATGPVSTGVFVTGGLGPVSDGISVLAKGKENYGVLSQATNTSGHAFHAIATGIGGHGVYSLATDTNGVGVSGTSSLGVGVIGNTGRADHDYGLYTEDNLYVGGKIDLVGVIDPVIAERFRTDPEREYEPGDVVCIGDGGTAIPCTGADATGILGVVSPDLDEENGEILVVIMGYRGAAPDTGSLALPADETDQAAAGRMVIRVKADAGYGAITAGDLLTSSPHAGHAMKARPVDIGGISLHRPGTIVGKAMGSLATGTGMVDIFVTLQ